jgi:hypothetical protein
VSLTASFRGQKKIICGKSTIYKNSQNAKKNQKITKLPEKKSLVMRIGWKMHYLQPITGFYDFFLRKTKIFQKFIKPTKNFFWQKQKNTCLMVLNDKPNCQVSRILMNPRPILSDSSEIHPNTKFFQKFIKPTKKIKAFKFKSHVNFMACFCEILRHFLV